MRVVDRWTTQDGSWEVDPSKRYSIDKVHAEKYPPATVPGAGGDHHVFVYTFGGNVIDFNTSDGKNQHTEYLPASGWVNFAIFGSSGYYPDRGDKGPWRVAVGGQVVVDGIGLPDHEHVSTFLVIGEGDPDVGNSNPEHDSYLVINGVTVWHN